jgi:hypothetical protein
MERYPSLSAIPALPSTAEQPVEYLSSDQVISIGFLEEGYWIVRAPLPDGREGYLRMSGDMWNIQVSGPQTADALGVDGWREAIGRFF